MECEEDEHLQSGNAGKIKFIDRNMRFDSVRSVHLGRVTMRNVFRLIMLMLLLGGCSGRSYQGPSGTVVPGRPTVLIAVLKGSSSPFKEKLIQQIMHSYADTCNVIAKEIRGYKDLQDNDYKAVIVMDRLKAWLLFNRPLKKIVKRLKPERTIYFISTGDPSWHWKRDDIKLVTSATASGDSSDPLRRLSNILDVILQM